MTDRGPETLEESDPWTRPSSYRGTAQACWAYAELDWNRPLGP
jgi:hypothetical protein